MELRNPDPSCNPYLTLAACLAAGLDGIERKLLPPEEITENIFEMNAEERAAQRYRGPAGFPGARPGGVKGGPLIGRGAGPPHSPPIHRRKEKEWEEYCTRVSSWEIAKYMVLY